MGHKLSWMSQSQIENVAHALTQSASQMATILAGMMQRNREETLLPWNDRQFAALDVLTTSITLCTAQAQQDFNAIDQKRIPHGEKTIAKRAERQTKAVDLSAAKKPVGRPRKKATR